MLNKKLTERERNEEDVEQWPEKTKKKTPRPRKKDAADASDQMTIWDVMESP